MKNKTSKLKQIALAAVMGASLGSMTCCNSEVKSGTFTYQGFHKDKIDGDWEYTYVFDNEPKAYRVGPIDLSPTGKAAYKDSLEIGQDYLIKYTDRKSGQDKLLSARPIKE